VRRDRHLALIQGYHVGKRAGRIEAEREIAESLDALRREMHVQSEP
jgi:hypothetical protein